MVLQMSSYIKDTTDFITKQSALSLDLTDVLLVTLDVSSLYTNIPHQEGMEAVRSHLHCTGRGDGPPSECQLKVLLPEEIFTWDAER
ncbi:hypothetical protein FKM82_008209 [Ascaphus truei]